jgi:hypothetical protein
MSMNVATADRQAVVRFPKAVSERIAPARRAVQTSYVQRLKVLIASPSDAERDQVFRAIADWNGGLGNADRRIVFVPLMWEKHAIADADKTPQEAINEQLLNRADLLLAVFNSRLGTPTKDYPAGTIEELDRRDGKAAVFFHKRPQPNRNPVDGRAQYNRLMVFKKSFKGFAKVYKDGDDLADMVRDQLEGWSGELYEEDRIPLVARPGPWKFDNLKRLLGAEDEPLSLLVFNSELACFRSPQAFAQQWGFLTD